jgi:hypothetical protein
MTKSIFYPGASNRVSKHDFFQYGKKINLKTLVSTKSCASEEEFTSMMMLLLFENDLVVDTKALSK